MDSTARISRVFLETYNDPSRNLIERAFDTPTAKTRPEIWMTIYVLTRAQWMLCVSGVRALPHLRRGGLRVTFAGHRLH